MLFFNENDNSKLKDKIEDLESNKDYNFRNNLEIEDVLNSKVNSALETYLTDTLMEKYQDENPMYHVFIDNFLHIVIDMAEYYHLDYNIIYVMAMYSHYNLIRNDKGYSHYLNKDAINSGSSNIVVKDVIDGIINDKKLLEFFSNENINLIYNLLKEYQNNQYINLYTRVLHDAELLTHNTNITLLVYEFIMKSKFDNNFIIDDDCILNMKIAFKDNLSSLSSKFLLKSKIHTKYLSKTIEITNDIIKDVVYYLKRRSLIPYRVLKNGKELLENFTIDNEEEILNEDNSSLSNKRKKVIEFIIKAINLVDKTKKNGNKYQEFFDKMSDKQFDDYMKKLRDNEDENFYMQILPNDNEPSLEDIKKGLNYINIPTEEYVYFRHRGHKDNPLRTSNPVSVGFLTIKRLQQILTKKNRYSLAADKRNMKTGQVTGEDESARVSDLESYALLALNADNALKEFLGPRADNMSMKTQFYQQIANEGYVNLRDLTDDISEHQSLNTVSTYLYGAGLENDLLDSDKDKLIKDITTKIKNKQN